jgi:hypothetical protein
VNPDLEKDWTPWSYLENTDAYLYEIDRKSKELARQRKLYEYQAGMRDEAYYTEQNERRQIEGRKQHRFNNGRYVICSQCEARVPHDENDYICIACRDGIGALPEVELNVRKEWLAAQGV